MGTDYRSVEKARCPAPWLSGRKVVSDKLSCSQKADVAQLVEQSIRNRQVIGSSPIVGSSPFQSNGIACANKIVASL
jgi:hypothetical protein